MAVSSTLDGRSGPPGGNDGARSTGGISKEHRKVILASSLGTVFEWYDFYLYGS